MDECVALNEEAVMYQEEVDDRDCFETCDGAHPVPDEEGFVECLLECDPTIFDDMPEMPEMTEEMQ